jgi:hypothetical protein
LLVLSQQFEPVRDIDKQAVDKDLQSRETTLLATLAGKSGRLTHPTQR